MSPPGRPERQGWRHAGAIAHIAPPPRARADVVVHKGPDHEILKLEWNGP